MNSYELYYALTMIAVVVSFAAQIYVQSVYSKYSRIDSLNMLTGASVASKILMNNNLDGVNVVASNGYLSDHYDPRSKSVVLSSNNYNSSSIASVAISAHECGHALQDKQQYAFLAFRSMLLPIANFSSYAGYLAIMMGLMLSMVNLVWLGIFLELFILAFQVVTLPVEFDASSKALAQIQANGILNNEELTDAKKVLTAAAFTYVASVATTLIQILRLVLMVSPRRNRRS